MYIVKVDLIDQVVRFLLLLVLHQLTLQVQDLNFLSTSHLFVISSSQFFIFSPHHLINLSSLHLLPLLQLPTFQLLIISSFTSPLSPLKRILKSFSFQLSMRLRQDPGVEQAKGESQNNSCQGAILTSNGSFHGMKLLSLYLARLRRMVR